MARSATAEGPHPVDRHVGRRVAERRIALGLTQTDLAQALGLTFQQIQKYEKGVNRISASRLWETAQFLGVEIDDVFAGLAVDATVPDEAGSPDPGFPPTRQSLEIARLSRQLSTRRQKLALDLMNSLSPARA